MTHLAEPANTLKHGEETIQLLKTGGTDSLVMSRTVRHDFTLEIFDVVQNRIAVIIGQCPMILMRKPDESFRDAHEFSHLRFQIAKRGMGEFRHGQQPFSQRSAVGRSRRPSVGCGGLDI